MKRCPQCNRVEADATLVFCRTDGAPLVPESSPRGSESGTSQLSSNPLPRRHAVQGFNTAHRSTRIKMRLLLCA